MHHDHYKIQYNDEYSLCYQHVHVSWQEWDTGRSGLAVHQCTSFVSLFKIKYTLFVSVSLILKQTPWALMLKLCISRHTLCRTFLLYKSILERMLAFNLLVPFRPTHQPIHCPWSLNVREERKGLQEATTGDPSQPGPWASGVKVRRV